jgi:hypothetical protein
MGPGKEAVTMPQTHLITIKLDGGKKIRVSPDEIVAYDGDNVDWDVQPDGPTHCVEIEFEHKHGAHGPFKWPSEKQLTNPVRGRYLHIGTGHVTTRAEDVTPSMKRDEERLWKYSVKISDAEQGTVIDTKDPGVKIKKH